MSDERTIYLDRKPFNVKGNEITEPELRDLPVEPMARDMEIWLEQPNEDVRVSLDRPVVLRGGERFYTTPKFINAGSLPVDDAQDRLREEGRVTVTEAAESLLAKEDKHLIVDANEQGLELRVPEDLGPRPEGLEVRDE